MACTNIVGDAGDLMRPDVLLLQRVMGIALCQEVLEEAHVLKSEEGDLMMRLLGVSFPFQPPEVPSWGSLDG